MRQAVLSRVAADRHATRAQQLGLPLDRQLGITVDHRFALSNPALVSASSKKRSHRPFRCG